MEDFCCYVLWKGRRELGISISEVTLDKLILGMKERFDQSLNTIQAQELMDSLNKQPHESWVRFIERFVVIASKCSLPEPHQVAWILKRVPSNLQITLSTLRLANVDVTVQGIITALQQCQNRGMDVLLGGNVNTESISVIKENKKKSKREKLFCKTHKWCHHTTEKCKGILKKNNKSYLFLNYVQGNQDFLINVNILNKNSFGLVESGAHRSCINEEYAKFLQIEPDYKEELFSFNNTSVKVMVSKPITITILKKNLIKDLQSLKICYIQ